MSKLAEHIDLFDQVLKQELDAQAMAAFERKLAADPDLKTAFEEYQSSVLLLQSASVFEEVGAIIDQHEKGKSVPLFQKHSMVLGIAASVSIVMVIAIAWLLNSRQSPEALYLAHFEPYPDLISERNSLSNESAMYHYNIGNYAQTIVLFEDQPDLDMNEQFYLAVAYLANGDHASAEQLLLTLLSTEKEEFAMWYLGLVYLAKGEGDKAVVVLTQIGPDDFQSKSATEILEVLE